MSTIIKTTLDDGAYLTVQDIGDRFVTTYIALDDSETWVDDSWPDAFQTYANCLNSVFDDQLRIIVE